MKETLIIRKAAYFEKETEQLREAGRSASWYTILTKVMDDDAPTLWFISDLEPNKQPAELAEELAVHFTDITNEARKLVESCLLYTSPSPRD